MTLDFLDFLKKAKGRFAFVATYEFDPLFFERRILCTPAFDGGSVVVFVDRDRYSEILASGRQGQGFDRNYFVVPIGRSSGVFHPKLYLALGDKKAIASVGSNNCTSAGTGHNFELISTVEMTVGEELDANARLITSIYRQFERYAQEAGPVSKWLKRDVFDKARADNPWLSEANAGGDEAGDRIELLSSHDDPLWPQLAERLAGSEVSKVTMLAPFFDRNLRMVERMRALWPGAAIRLVSQSGYSNLPVARLVELRDEGVDIELISATPQKAGRKMHAKALTFQTPERTYWLAGSANMSNAALAGGNSEACLWFAAKQNASKALEQDDLSFEPIDPEDFQAAPIEEPERPVDDRHGLELLSLILTEDGQLLAVVIVPKHVSDVTLKIIKRNEALPTFSWRIEAGKAEIALPLKGDDQAKFDRPAVGLLQGVVGGREVSSGLCSVKQLERLLRDRTGGNAAGNRIQRITESGDGLVEYLDALEGVDAAIDFMNRTTIRFSDGALSGVGSGGGRWRARDPFSGDVPEHWEIGSRGGSAAELREAIWAFVERHVQTRLKRHAKRGNLGGLANFLDIYRAISRLLLAWHSRRIDGEVVIPGPYVIRGMQDILTTLIGARGDQQDETPGYGRVILSNLSADEALVRSEFSRHRVPALVYATMDEVIRVRAVLKRIPIYDGWSQDKREWVSDWIAHMGIDIPHDGDVHEIGAEFRMAA